MSLLYDSTNPFDIPIGVQAAGYCDGIYTWPDAGWARFPSALKIAVFAGTNDGHALDVEQGDANPWEAPSWVKRRLAAGIPRPWVYCNRANRGAVEFELRRAGITTDQVALWVATLDGTQTVPAGLYPVAAVQYANTTLSGGHYDLSLVNDVFGPGGGTIEGTMTSTDVKAVILAAIHGTGQGLLYTQTQVDAEAANYNSANLDRIIADIVNTPAATAYKNAVAALIKAGGAPVPDDDSAFVTKTALKAAIGGL